MLGVGCVAKQGRRSIGHCLLNAVLLGTVALDQLDGTGVPFLRSGLAFRKSDVG